MHLGVQSCVTGWLKMLTYYTLFRQPAPCSEPQSTIFEKGFYTSSFKNKSKSGLRFILIQ